MSGTPQGCPDSSLCFKQLISSLIFVTPAVTVLPLDESLWCWQGAALLSSPTMHSLAKSSELLEQRGLVSHAGKAQIKCLLCMLRVLLSNQCWAAQDLEGKLKQQVLATLLQLGLHLWISEPEVAISRSSIWDRRPGFAKQNRGITEVGKDTPLHGGTEPSCEHNPIFIISHATKPCLNPGLAIEDGN